ncbi:hypothetical protein ACEUD0_14380 [Aeromonas veronii]
MTIQINPLNWGDAEVDNIQKVLESVVCVMDLYFESKLESDIVVTNDPIEGPMVCYERGRNGEYQVLLSSSGLFWSQYSYQFSHEYCHIRTNYMSGNHKTKWFDETICELASLFTLRRMSEVWQISPPYPNWRDYSSALYEYAESRISDDKHKLPEDIDFTDWFRSRLADLERDQYIRETNTKIAIKLLPIFEANPRLWLALSYFNKWDTSEIDDIYQCFDNWQSIVPIELKHMVVSLVSVFGSKA